jgi:hypothetical protein
MLRGINVPPRHAAACEPSSNTSWIGESVYYYDPRLLLRSPLAGGLSRSSSRARGGDFRTALSFAGLPDKLSQLPGERRSAIYGFLFVPLALKPFFYIVNRCRFSGSSQLKSAFKR